MKTVFVTLAALLLLIAAQTQAHHSVSYTHLTLPTILRV